MRLITCIYFEIIGSFWNFPLLWLAVVIILVLVLRHSIEKRSILYVNLSTTILWHSSSKRTVLWAYCPATRVNGVIVNSHVKTIDADIVRPSSSICVVCAYSHLSLIPVAGRAMGRGCICRLVLALTIKVSVPGRFVVHLSCSLNVYISAIRNTCNYCQINNHKTKALYMYVQYLRRITEGRFLKVHKSVL